MTVTFDFDDTLTKPIQNENGLWVCSNQPYDEIINGIFQTHIQNGDDVHIVTTRLATNPVDDFVSEHNLEIESIRYTGGVLKSTVLDDIGSEIHYDDCIYEIMECSKGVQGIVVVHPFDTDESFIENTEHIMTDYCKMYCRASVS